MAPIETTHDTRLTRGRQSIFGPGIGAGIAAAIVMGLVWMIVAAARGTGFWTPMMWIGATYLGVDWTDVPAWAAVLGVGTHLVLGAAFGLLFAALARNVRAAGARAAAGLVYGAAVYLFMTYLVLPWADPVMYVVIDKGLFFLYHLAFGFVLAFAMPVRRVTFVPRRREAY